MPDTDRPSLLRRLFGGKSSVDGMRIVEPTPQVIEILGMFGSWSSLGGMYKRQTAVRTVVDFLGRNIASIGVKVYERVGNADRLELDEHPLSVLLRKPNPSTTAYQHMERTVKDLCIYDVAYWYKLRAPGTRRVSGVLRVPVPYIVLDTQTIGTKEQIRYRWQDGREIPRDDLVVFSGYSPDSNITGTPPLETLRQTLAEDWAASQDREGFWANAARIAGVIQRPLDAPGWSDVARERFRKDWAAAMAGAQNSGKTGILEEGMTWASAQFSPKDAQYLEGRKATKEEVATQYGIMPTMIGLLDHATFSNVDAQHRQLYQDVLSPWTRRLEDEIELQVLPEFEMFDAQSRVYVEFNIAEKLRGSMEEQTASLTSSIGVPLMSVNEGRSLLNLPRIADPLFDVPVRPANVLYGGQAATNVPLADPGTPPKPALMAASAEPDFTDPLRQVLVRYFERQRRSLASAGPAKAFNSARWTRELAEDLREPAFAVASYAGKQVAGEHFDADRAETYALEWALRISEGVNTRTRIALVEHKAQDVFDTLTGGIEVLAGQMVKDIAQGAVALAPAALGVGVGLASAASDEEAS